MCGKTNLFVGRKLELASEILPEQWAAALS